MVSLYSIGMALLVVAILVLCTLAIVPPRSVRLSLQSFERRGGTAPAAVLGAATVGLLLVTLSLAVSSAGASEFGLLDGLFTAFAAFGPIGVAVGLSARATRQRLLMASESRTGSPETNLIAVDGALQAVAGTFDVPERASDDVLTCAYALQKDRGLFSTRSAWVTIAEGERTAPLVIDDGSGPVRVDEDAVDIRSGRPADRRYTISLPEDEDVPEEVGRFLAELGVESPGRPDSDHRLRLRPLTKGDPVTAFGTYERVTRAGDAFWGITDDTEPASLFPGNRESVKTLLGRRSRWLSGGGAVLTLLGGGYVAALLLPAL